MPLAAPTHLDTDMAKKELRIDFDKISNPQTITQENIRLFKEHGLDTKKNEVDEIVDDHSIRQRIYKVRHTKFFGPWGHRG
jgi:hypothetical protein